MIQSSPLNEFDKVHYNPNFFNKIISTKPVINTYNIIPSSQIYTGSNTYTLGSITLSPGRYLVNVQYAFQGIWSAIGSITNCALSISSSQTISTGTATPTFFYCQGPALQTSVLNQIYNFGINGSGVIIIPINTTIYLNTFCFYTGTAVIQNQIGNIGSVSLTYL